jgi:hypothetical protein
MGGIVGRWTGRKYAGKEEEGNPGEEFTSKTETIRYGVHYQTYKQWLNTFSSDVSSVPENGSVDLKYIRLFNKEKFLKSSLVVDCICILQTLVMESNLFMEGNKWKAHPTSQFWESYSQLQQRKDALERLLLWNWNQSDQSFELFELSECPDFSFLSHRFTHTGPLGRDGELIIYLAHCQHPYVWFDVGCFPSLQEDDLKSITEVQRYKLLSQRHQLCHRASSFHGYYLTDGLVKSLDFQWFQDNNSLREILPTNGLLSLCNLLQNILKQKFLSNPTSREIDYALLSTQIQEHNAFAKNTLQCLFDDLLTPHLQKLSTNGLFLPFFTSTSPLSLLPPAPLKPYSDDNVFVDYLAMEPLTSQLYSQKLLPAVFTPDTFYCRDPMTSRLIPGLTLPQLQQLASLPSFASPLCLGNPPLVSYGWTFYKDSEIWLLNLEWKQHREGEGDPVALDQKQRNGDLFLHLHHKCLLSCRERVVMFNPSKSQTQSFSTLSSDDHNPSESLLSQCSPLPCVICRRLITTSVVSPSRLTSSIASDWICPICRCVNDGNISQCVKCHHEEERLIDPSLVDNTDYQLGDRVQIQSHDSLSAVGYISHVYRSDMYDVTFLEKVEKYVDKSTLVREGSIQNHNQYERMTRKEKDRLGKGKRDELYRPCGVCSYLNISTEENCKLCSLKLGKITQETTECMLYPIGTPVLVQISHPSTSAGKGTGKGTEKQKESSEDNQEEAMAVSYSYEPGVVKEIHRYGLYSVELERSGKVLRYVREDMVSELGPASEISWKCPGCSHANKSYFSLDPHKGSTKENPAAAAASALKCSKCGLLKPSVSHQRHFAYVENASLMLGAKVEAKYHGGEIYYPGVVIGITRDGLYEVEYDHGELETDIKEENLIVIAIFCGSFGNS